jgi:hypothetical protein
MRAFLELAAWLQAGEDRAIAAGSGRAAKRINRIKKAAVVPYWLLRSPGFDGASSGHKKVQTRQSTCCLEIRNTPGLVVGRLSHVLPSLFLPSSFSFPSLLALTRRLAAGAPPLGMSCSCQRCCCCSRSCSCSRCCFYLERPWCRPHALCFCFWLHALAGSPVRSLVRYSVLHAL